MSAQFAEKLEECPRCQADKLPSWNYDAQNCECGYDYRWSKPEGAFSLLQWAMAEGELGVYCAGSGLYGDGESWACHGCKAVDTHKGRGHYDHNKFPHKRDCKYIAAMKVLESGTSPTRNIK